MARYEVSDELWVRIEPLLLSELDAHADQVGCLWTIGPA
jgi:hypothetical protein